MTHIGLALKFIRQSMQMEQKDVADRSGLTRSFISAIETGTRDPSWNSVLKICAALGVDVTMVTMLLEKDKPAIKPLLPIVLSQLWEKGQVHAILD